MSLFSENDKERKMTVIWRYFTRYFPKAHREVTKVCVANNVRYNPEREPNDINWARGKSPDQLGSAQRHMLEREVDGKVFETLPKEIADVVGFDRVYVLAEAMWRVGAALELDIEEQEGLTKPEMQPGKCMVGARVRNKGGSYSRSWTGTIVAQGVSSSGWAGMWLVSPDDPDAAMAWVLGSSELADFDGDVEAGKRYRAQVYDELEVIS